MICSFLLCWSSEAACQCGVQWISGRGLASEVILVHNEAGGGDVGMGWSEIIVGVLKWMK